MEFDTTLTAMQADLLEVVRLFDPQLTDDLAIRHTETEGGSTVTNTVLINGQSTERRDKLGAALSAVERKRFRKRYAKLALYDALTQRYGCEMPWGALTGIRPTKLYYQLLRSCPDADLTAFFRDTFRVSAEKTALLADVIASQRTLLNRSERAVDVYVGIPFCTSRCAYCSFLSAEIGACAKQVEPYVAALLTEIAALKAIVRQGGYAVRAVYIGGGTPTSLPLPLFKRVVEACDFGQREFTCEAGRPDTIDAEKLSAMQGAGVDRISVNPQTFHDETLKRIGRRHTTAETLASLELAAKYPFDVNMDLIAGLPDEDLATFCASLDTAIALSPANVTVHTLALKSGASLKLAGYRAGSDVPEMVRYAYEKLKAAGYAPYYLYRQKYMASNLENVGYGKPGKACLYNVDIMEENTSILACGANSITKRVFRAEDRIERQADNKDIASYIANIEALIERKRKLFFSERTAK